MAEYSKAIICLARLRKYAGRCVAGKEQAGAKAGAWVRPVSARPDEELAAADILCADGRPVELLDVVRVPCCESRPRGFQRENHLIRNGARWTRLGAVSPAELPALCDRPDALWHVGCSTFHGRNDRVPGHLAEDYDRSLHLITPESLVVLVRDEGREFGAAKRRVRVRFMYNRIRYCLPLTDPDMEARYLQKPGENEEVHLLAEAPGQVFLCVSLGLLHTDGFCYKLAASLIAPNRL